MHCDVDCQVELEGKSTSCHELHHREERGTRRERTGVSGESRHELLLYADDTALLPIKHLSNVTQAQKLKEEVML